MPVTKQKHPSLFKLRHLAMVFPQMREGRVVGGGGGGGRTLRYPLFIKIPPLATEDVVYQF